MVQPDGALRGRDASPPAAAHAGSRQVYRGYQCVQQRVLVAAGSGHGTCRLHVAVLCAGARKRAQRCRLGAPRRRRLPRHRRGCNCHRQRSSLHGRDLQQPAQPFAINLAQRWCHCWYRHWLRRLCCLCYCCCPVLRGSDVLQGRDADVRTDAQGRCGSPICLFEALGSLSRLKQGTLSPAQVLASQAAHTPFRFYTYSYSTPRW